MKKELNTQLGHLPPQDLEIEEVVLGALMLDLNALNAFIDILIPEIFYSPKHIKIMSAILRLYDKSEAIDILTVTQELRSSGDLELSGGAFYVTQLTSRVNSSANTEYHVRILQEMYIRRSIIKTSSLMVKSAYNDEIDVFECLNAAEKGIFDITNMTSKKEVRNMASSMREAIKEIEIRQSKSSMITGVSCGLLGIDKITCGFQKSDLIILAARPGMGKTALALNMCMNAAIEDKVPVAFFSLEMSNQQLTNRLISSYCELDSKEIKTGTLSDASFKRMHEKATPLIESKIFIDDTPGLSIREFRSKARNLKNKHNIQKIYVDYVQLMTAEGTQNKNAEVGEITRGLKLVAKELDLPVIALSQLSRTVESRGGDKKPQLSDLRDSGSIEQDADAVMFLYRPSYYGMNPTDENGNALPKGFTELIFAKHRGGSLDTAHLNFQGFFTKFSDFKEESDNMTPLADVPSDDKFFTE